VPFIIYIAWSQTLDANRLILVAHEYMKGWQKRNPNFYVFNAVLHLDERTPHLHIDYIPVAESKRGLSVQNGMAKALEQMGYDSRSAQGFNDWRQNERRILTELCEGRGMEIAEPEASRGVSLLPDEYKAQKDAEKQALQDEIDKVALRATSEKTALQAEITKLQAEAEQYKVEAEQYRATLADAEARLQEALAPIEEQIDVALAKKANNNVIKDIEIKKQPLTGAIVLSRKTKSETLTIEQVEGALELAKNQRSHEIRCNKKVSTVRAEAEAIKTKVKEEIGLAKKELEEQRFIAKQATDAWSDVIKTLDGSTLNSVKVYSPENIADTVKYLKDGFFKHKKAAEQVSGLEQRIGVLEQNQASWRQQEFAELPVDIQNILLSQGEQMARDARQVQIQAAEHARRVQVETAAAEKERLRSLHKMSKWSELTPDERREVRRLLVNAPEFPNRQDYLDFKRAFGGSVERER